MKKLTESQKLFAGSLLPLAEHVQDLTRRKAIEYKGIMEAVGLNPTVFICEVVITSNWGTHPVSQETYKGKSANNLLLLQPVSLWDGPRARFEGQDYCMYLSWDEFAVEFSDYIVFSGLYTYLLKERDIAKQIRYFSLTSGTSCDSIDKTINLLGIKCQKFSTCEVLKTIQIFPIKN